MDQQEEAYYKETLRLLEDVYVSADERGDVAGGSGSSSGLGRWEAKRRLIADAFDHDGTWLDAGCANGLLMETLHAWAAEKGVCIEPYGLELSHRIAHRARLRLPHWAERIRTGNIMEWSPPMRFDYVTLLPEYVPEQRFAAMLTRVQEEFLNPHGRVIVSCYFGGRPEGAPPLIPASELLARYGFTALGDREARRENESLWTSVAWFDRTG
jgi:hypothetical protein